MKKIIITGNVGQDPEEKYSPNGESFLTFSVGVNVGTKLKPRTDWVEISCNAKLAEIAKEFVKKGTKVLIEGFPSSSAYINKSGEAVAILRISAKVIELIGGKQQDGGDRKNNYEPPADYGSSDDIPF